MAKVVYNGCFGGFSVSEAGVRRYCELKGLPLWVEREGMSAKFSSILPPTYWVEPPENRPPTWTDEEFHQHSLDERAEHNAHYERCTLSDNGFLRDDPYLVRVVEELGEAANGRCAKLEIRDIPDGSKYRIDEYDGNERVMLQDEYEWSVA